MSKADQKTPVPWSAPIRIEDVPDTGRRVVLSADAHVREAVARLANLSGVPRLEATFDLVKQGADGLHVSGEVSATVGQTCVVTLEPIENEVREPVDLAFAPDVTAISPEEGGEAEEPPEPLVDGTVDLGAIATEFLILGIDPYPRKPGAVFVAPPVAESEEHPFAALAALKKRRDPPA
jgi:uncharacterized metal-binding protein YceD (DUF177 family)